MPKNTEEAEAPSLHVVVGNTPYFGEDSVLHAPGDVVLAVASTAGDNLEPSDGSNAGVASEVRIASVAPHAGGPNPQGLPPGTKETGSGQFVAKGTPGTDGQPQQYVAEGGPTPGPTPDPAPPADKGAKAADKA